MSRMPLRPPHLHEGLLTDGVYVFTPHTTPPPGGAVPSISFRHWQDARGAAVARLPDCVKPSTTVIVYDDLSDLSQPERCAVGRQHATDAWRVLVQQRADNGWWGFPGGSQEIGESIQACAVRETQEETGYDVTLGALVCVDSDPAQHAILQYPDGNVIQYTNLTFLATVCGGALCCSPESQRVEWHWTDALPEPFLPAHRWRLAQAYAVLLGKQGAVAVR